MGKILTNCRGIIHSPTLLRKVITPMLRNCETKIHETESIFAELKIHQEYTMNVVLASNDHFAFSSSTWSKWAGSPYDLQLVAKDGAVGAHRGLLLPLLQPLAVLVQATGCCGTAQLMLPDSSLAAITAAKDLLYNGCCQLDMDSVCPILHTSSFF